MNELVYQHWHEGLDPRVCVSVDGDAPGRLHLSHWPGNRTPAEFRHDLSTGSCLLLAKSERRAELLSGITTVTNNHWDTDGLCSAFVMVLPGLALEQAPLLVAAAMAGDYDLFTTPEGVKINLTLTALTRHEHSPVRTALFGTDLEARIAQYRHGLNLLPQLLANPDLHADWFAREYWTIMKDLRAMREDQAMILRHEPHDLVEVRGDRRFHVVAVNTNCDAGTILEVVELDGAWLYELRYTTRTWFDMPSRPRTALNARRDWQPLLSALNQDCSAPGGHWAADDWREPNAGLRFVDNAGRPAPNATPPQDLARQVRAHLFEPAAGAAGGPVGPDAG